MTFFQILDSLLFQPLQLLFEVIYVNANRVIGNPGLSIIVLSLVMNFLVLPLYMRADALQEEPAAEETADGEAQEPEQEEQGEDA